MKTKRQPYRKNATPAVGDKYGHLVITDPLVKRDSHGNRYVKAVCALDGVEKTFIFSKLANKRTVSCGCVKVKNFNKHRTRLGNMLPLELARRIWDYRGCLADGRAGYKKQNAALILQFAPELERFEMTARNANLCMEQTIRKINAHNKADLGANIEGFTLELARLILDDALHGSEYQIDHQWDDFDPHLSGRYLTGSAAAARAVDESDCLFFNTFGSYSVEALSGDGTVPVAVKLAVDICNLKWLRTCKGVRTRDLLKLAQQVRTLAYKSLGNRGVKTLKISQTWDENWMYAYRLETRRHYNQLVDEELYPERFPPKVYAPIPEEPPIVLDDIADDVAADMTTTAVLESIPEIAKPEKLVARQHDEIWRSFFDPTWAAAPPPVTEDEDQPF
jgi:hypothetical protein